jgi:hypothetical protein
MSGTKFLYDLSWVEVLIQVAMEITILWDIRLCTLTLRL